MQNKQGFTLVEMLTVVLIVAILMGIAMPNYTRSIERSRATEAMTAIKTLNDAIYAYSAQRNTCPDKYTKLTVKIPGTRNSDTVLSTKNFKYTLNGAPVTVPGTECKGVLAERVNGGRYNYKIWNPFSGSHSLACYADESNTKSVAICESLDIYTPNFQ